VSKWSWWPWGRYTVFGARQAGQDDGPRNFPPPNAPRPVGYLGELKNLAEKELRETADRWESRDRSLKPAVEAADDRSRGYVARLGELEERHTDLDKRGHFSDTAHWCIVGGLFVAEFPLNTVAFEIFRENMLFTVLVTLGLAFTLLLLAHISGIYLKEPSRTREQNCGMAVFAVVAVGVIAAVALLRERVLGEHSDRGVTYAFVVIQLLIFLVAVATTYAAHDPLRDQKLRCERARKALNEIRARRQKEHRQSQLEADRVRDIAQLLMAAYEGENIKHRTDESPTCRTSPLTSRTASRRWSLMLLSGLRGRTTRHEAAATRQGQPWTYGLQECGPVVVQREPRRRWAGADSGPAGLSLWLPRSYPRGR